MSKLSYLLLCMVFTLAMVVSPFISSVPVLADTTEETTTGDVTDPGILPDSGFYFMKKWGRNLQLMFTAGNAEKAKLMLKYTNEDALALKEMYEAGKYDVGARHAEQYSLQLQNTIQTIEQVRLQQGQEASEELIDKLEQNYLRQQEVLLSVVEKAPEAAQNGILNTIENSNKHVAAMILAQKGQEALAQYQEQVNQQTTNMGEETKIRVQQRLQVTHGQAEQTSTGSSEQGTMTQTQTKTQTQTQTQTSEQTMQQTGQQSGQQTMQNQGAGPNTDQSSDTQGAGNKKQGK